MTKMNRRDYLIGMGATGVFAAAKLDLYAHDTVETVSRVDSTQRNGIYVPSGDNTYDLLPTESVKLVFHGLMGLVLGSPNECVVGFHSKPSNKHKHRLNVMAFTNCAPSPQLPEPKQVPIGAKPILEILEPDLITGVKFYQPPINPWHTNDFRHVIDLEDPKWYGRRLHWKPDVYKPSMSIKNGLFYTLLKTGSTFKKQRQGESPTSPGVPIGSVAAYVGVNIYLKPRGRVTLKIPEAGIDLTLEQAPGVKHEIHFNNDCSKRWLGTECRFNPEHLDETERSDFYMHRDAVDLGTGDKYQLVREQRADKVPAPEICLLAHSTHLSQARRTVTDEAPCAALGYGYGGWPPYP
jgi:hypothetical protein